MCLVIPMKTDNVGGSSTYEALSAIDRSFEHILRELEHLQKPPWLRKRKPIESVALAVRETRAWTLFEILEVLHERAESEWTRLGRMRARKEEDRALSSRVSLR